ncbi:unnamed protein product, partial [Brenthis ino]
MSYRLGPSVCALPANLDNDVGAVDVDSISDVLDENKLLISFVVFRHGDRTPQQIELDLYPAAPFNESIFYPYGKEALTIKGKQRAYSLGQYLRKRYNDTISQLYIPNEITVRTTDYARTKMTALVVLAAMYPPTSEQNWNEDLNWQPIPYDTINKMDDDLLVFVNCPRYNELHDHVYKDPAISTIIKSYQSLFQLLSVKTGGKITKPKNVFFLDNLFQALENSGVKNDKWIEDVFSELKEVTKIDYSCLFYTDEQIKLSTGVLLHEIVNIMKMAVAGDQEQAKLHLYSAHENNVAALLAALKIFKPHQPKYGSSIALELRRNLRTGKHGVMAVYAREAGGPGEVIPIGGCEEKIICDFDRFLNSIENMLLPRSEYREQCLSHVEN